MDAVVRLEDPLVVFPPPGQCHQIFEDSYPAALHLAHFHLWDNRPERFSRSGTLRGVQDTVRILGESVH